MLSSLSPGAEVIRFPAGTDPADIKKAIAERGLPKDALILADRTCQNAMDGVSIGVNLDAAFQEALYGTHDMRVNDYMRELMDLERKMGWWNPMMGTEEEAKEYVTALLEMSNSIQEDFERVLREILDGVEVSAQQMILVTDKLQEHAPFPALAKAWTTMLSRGFFERTSRGKRKVYLDTSSKPEKARQHMESFMFRPLPEDDKLDAYTDREGLTRVRRVSDTIAGVLKDTLGVQVVVKQKAELSEDDGKEGIMIFQDRHARLDDSYLNVFSLPLNSLVQDLVSRGLVSQDKLNELVETVQAVIEEKRG